MLPSIALLFAILAGGVGGDTARMVGSTLVIDPVGVRVDLPPEWFGAGDSVARPPGCGHHVRGAEELRLATSRAILDSLRRHARGEWDREYVAVTDSMLPFDDLVAQVGPEPLGSGACFADLQVRVYVLPEGPTPPVMRDTAALSTARGFFPSATLALRDSAEWHVDHIRWDAWYSDYGAEANVEAFRTSVRGRTLVLVFMRASWKRGPAEHDEQYILQHVRF